MQLVHLKVLMLRVAPSSVSKMGAVITYEETGTNVLNTDIVMKLSAETQIEFHDSNT